ncbi:MAG: fructosamine kinase family protein [Ancrocorticia sp.]
MGDAPLLLVSAGSSARKWGEFYAQDRLLPYLPDALRNGSIGTGGQRIIEQLCEKLRDGAFDSPQPKLVTTDAALLHGDLWAGNIFWTRDTSDLDERVLMRNPKLRYTSTSIASSREAREILGTRNVSYVADTRETADSRRRTAEGPEVADSRRQVTDVVAVLIDPACQGGHAESDLAQLTVFSAPFTERIYHSYHEVSPFADGWRERIGLHQLHILMVHAALFGGSYGVQTISVARKYI